MLDKRNEGTTGGTPAEGMEDIDPGIPPIDEGPERLPF